MILRHPDLFTIPFDPGSLSEFVCWEDSERISHIYFRWFPYDHDFTSVGSGISWDDAISMLNAWKTANPNSVVNVSITQ